MRTLLLSFLLIGTLTFTSGCGQKYPLHPVEGTVTLDGSALEGATVTFQPAGSGKPASGRTDSNGKYSLRDLRADAGDGAEVGQYNVTVLWQPPPAVDLSQMTGQTATYSPSDEAKRRNITSRNMPKSAMPAAYGDANKSGLKASVEKGKRNTVDLTLVGDFKGA